jgi:hypothetical protein
MENRKSNEIKMTNFLDLFYLLSIMFSPFVLFIACFSNNKEWFNQRAGKLLITKLVSIPKII